jgi:hypothetical protein
VARRLPKRRIRARLTFDLPDRPMALDEIERRLGKQLDRQRPSVRRQIRGQLGAGNAGKTSPPPELDAG